MKNGKRILSVTIKQMADESPDTSWMGEYSDTRTSTFSIDRAHDLNCQSQFGQQEYVVQLFDQHEEEIGGAVFLDKAKAEEYAVFHKQSNPDLTSDIESRDAECNCGRGDSNGHDYQYFNPSFNYVDKKGNPNGMTAEDVKKYTLQDYERMESLNNGYWSFIGITAVAEIQLGTDVVQRITSGGLWGIESDSKDYIKEVTSEQLNELKTQLLAIGFSKRAISTAFKNVKESE